ncbi:MAG: hypothetical protein AAF368_00880 [Planctomycetota bacterium]
MFDFADLFSLKENDFLSLKNAYSVKDFACVYAELFDLDFDLGLGFICAVLRRQLARNDFTINPRKKGEKPRGSLTRRAGHALRARPQAAAHRRQGGRDARAGRPARHPPARAHRQLDPVAARAATARDQRQVATRADRWG